ncbi:hypothetical protein PALI_b0627 [Pseudoalteromonas aliena SW19]|uniref:Uncharacterized protein n=1 Tax=Pseudoalteromonas aliena SW19 TaxID=1314866 RepID=A0ABR9E4T5_9GAMM|nr:hypothetical protein [Pseudoalteromonas aliena SW19]
MAAFVRAFAQKVTSKNCPMQLFVTCAIYHSFHHFLDGEAIL